MKIAYVLDTFPASTETFIAREIAALRRRGFEIVIFALHAGAGAQPLAEATATQRWRGKLAGVLSAAARLEYFKAWGVRSWRENNSWRGVEHIHGGWASYPALVAWGAAEAAGVPWSFSGHARDLFVDGEHWPQKLETTRFATACTRAGTRFLQDAAPAMAPKVLYAPHGLDIEKYSYLTLNSREPLIVSAGRLVEKKGFDTLLDALALQQNHAPVRAAIIGDGSLRAALERQKSRLGLDDVEFTGHLEHAQVVEYFQRAGCFALPCRVARDGDRDGLPNVLLEAAACGAPLVAARAGGVEEFVDETIGRLCPPDDAAALAHALDAVFTHPAESRRRCEAARRRVERDFDIERNIERLASAFERSSS